MPDIKKFFVLIFFISELVFSQGKIYFVLGSDTGIWQGMDTKTYKNYYGDYLYINRNENTYRVMDPAFREKIKDSQGNPLKLTWWMHGGNIFRYGINQNVPHPNYLPLYLMNKYHGESIEQLGDEITLHYHTWVYKDYDSDGIFWWNQAKNFTECREDFDYTLAQYLLEEEVFPVSFRSGWHYMDNEWQNYLDELLPFSMHNDYPSKRLEDSEPIDNIFDWSLATPEFVPFHPSSDNYQLEGNLNGWNVRSKYFKSVSLEMLNQIFSEAESGKDQVACFWSHLPEADFLQQIEDLNSRIQQKSDEYPDVEFYYMTAVEAMQAWLKTRDTTEPELSISRNNFADGITFLIETNEPIFQKQPFVAVKNIFKEYEILQCEQTGVNKWETFPPLKEKDLVKAGFALTDSMGNLSTKIIKFIPDDLIIDNVDAEFIKQTNNFILSEEYAWGINSEIAQLQKNDSAIVKIDLPVKKDGLYNLFFQFAPNENLVDSLEVKIFRNSNLSSTKKIYGPFNFKKWIFISAENLSLSENPSIILKAVNSSETIKTFSPDVLKASAIVPDKQLIVSPEIFSFGEVRVNDTTIQKLKLENLGREGMTIKSISYNEINFKTEIDFPFILQAHSKIEIPFYFFSEEVKSLEDTLLIFSDDQIHPEIKIPIIANVNQYFEIVDNEDSLNYSESGDWRQSVANANGPTSRYSFLTNLNDFAEFRTELFKPGKYSVQELIPKTVNSTDNALYLLKVGDTIIDSVFADQNEGSGNWKEIFLIDLPAKLSLKVIVKNAGGFTMGDVLRADAFKFQLIDETTKAENEVTTMPSEISLSQNYPNPFNPSTKINFSIPAKNGASIVKLKIYDALGREIKTALNEIKSPGRYSIGFNGTGLASGVYFYTLETAGKMISKKMILLR